MLLHTTQVEIQVRCTGFSRYQGQQCGLWPTWGVVNQCLVLRISCVSWSCSAGKGSNLKTRCWCPWPYQVKQTVMKLDKQKHVELQTHSVTQENEMQHVLLWQDMSCDINFITLFKFCFNFQNCHHWIKLVGTRIKRRSDLQKLLV